MDSTAIDAPAIPVICDRCREEGLAGDDPFTAIRDLLNFEPVQRVFRNEHALDLASRIVEGGAHRVQPIQPHKAFRGL